MISVGIDSGSRAIKMVLLNQSDRTILASGVVDQGIHQVPLAEELLTELLQEIGEKRENVQAVVATGYGRDALSFADKRVTEITCHGYGVYTLHPEAKTVVDIGGQDSKVLRMGLKGRVQDFTMNDRCAAGTGRFLEVVSDRLETPLMEMGKLAVEAPDPSHISSMCVVFAETEIIGLLAEGKERHNIISGVCRSISSRVAAMAGKKVEGPVIFAGGVSLIPGMAEVMQEALGVEVLTAEMPQMTGALGAALIATTLN